MKKEGIIPVLTIQDDAFPLKVQTMGDFMQEQGESNNSPHSHNHYEMAWLTNGIGILHADMQDYTIESNSFFCLKPNQTHQFHPLPGMEGFVFSFKDSFFRMDEYDFDRVSEAAFFQLFSEKRVVWITHEVAEELKKIVLKMIVEVESQYFKSISLLTHYFKIVLIYLIRSARREIRATQLSRESGLAERFLGLLDMHFKQRKMATEYAAELSVTPNYLNRTVKKNTGYSVGYHIRQRVVLEAKRMGRFSDASMKEIGYDLGFLDCAHFSRFFKTFGGMNFSEFRRGALIVPLGTTPNRA